MGPVLAFSEFAKTLADRLLSKLIRVVVCQGSRLGPFLLGSSYHGFSPFLRSIITEKFLSWPSLVV